MSVARILPAMAIATSLLATSPAFADAPDRFGWVEKGLIRPENIAVKVKLDTGALTSSMHAENLEEFERDGKPWLRFDVELEDLDGRLVSSRFEREVLRTVDVRGAGGTEQRPVVRMSICIGDTVYTEQFSLNDRNDMNYPVLIGRRTLEDMGVVDVGRTFTTEPECEE